MSKNLRMRFIDIKTDGGRIKGKLSSYCRVLGVTRQGFYFFLKHRDDPWKYEGIIDTAGIFNLHKHLLIN